MHALFLSVLIIFKNLNLHLGSDESKTSKWLQNIKLKKKKNIDIYTYIYIYNTLHYLHEYCKHITFCCVFNLVGFFLAESRVF